MIRFSSTSGTTSATVPSVARPIPRKSISRSRGVTCFEPLARVAIAQASLKATPAPHSSPKG